MKTAEAYDVRDESIPTIIVGDDTILENYGDVADLMKKVAGHVDAFKEIKEKRDRIAAIMA